MNPTVSHTTSPHRIEGARYAGIVVKDGQILLMHRIKNGYEYYVLPGGHREQGETAQETITREIAEETSIQVQPTKLAFKHHDSKFHQDDIYYFCDWQSGDQPELVGEEKFKNSPQNSYRPLWVNVSKIKDLNILPPHAKEFLLQKYPILPSVFDK